MTQAHLIKSTQTRRELLQALASLSIVSVTGCGVDEGIDTSKPPAPGATVVKLSSYGSNHGTAYLQSNKVLALPDGGSLVTYLESNGRQVTVILEQLDQDLSTVRRMVVGPAWGNHGGAAMVLDSQQRLHILYGPHAGPMQYRRSQSSSGWFDLTVEQKFGELLTYPSLMVGTNDRLWVAAREGSGEQGANGTLEIWATDTQGFFQRVATPLINREVGYAAFNPSLHIDTLGRLHLLASIHEGTDEALYGRYQAITYITSDDEGKTWKNTRQEALALPATIAEAGSIFSGGMLEKKVVSAGVVTTDASGQVFASFLVEYVDQNLSSLMLARLEEGVWYLEDLRQICEMPPDYEFCDPGVMSVSGSKMMFASVVQNVSPTDRSMFHGTAWGHESNRVAIGKFNLRTRDGHFTLLPALGGLPGPYWLPNLQRTTRQDCEHSTTDVVIFTRGQPGGGYLAGGCDIFAHRL